MINLRKLIRNTLMETYGPDVVQYSAVVIEDPVEEQKIKDLAAQYVPAGWRVPAHYHMTISQEPIPQSLELRGDLNQEVNITINMVGMSNDAIAFGTFGYYSKNEMPHITIAFNKKYGATPASSKEITNWKPIDKIKVTGVIREIGDKNAILKEGVGDKVTIDWDDMDIIVGNEIVGDFHVYNNKKGNYLTLSKIEILPNYQGHGYATEAMKQIIEYANKNNLTIILTPDSYKGSNVNRLIKWHKSLGFIMNKGNKKDFGHMQLMYKLPSSLDETLDYAGKVTTTSRNAHAGVPAMFPQTDEFDQFGNEIGVIGV